MRVRFRYVKSAVPRASLYGRGGPQRGQGGRHSRSRDPVSPTGVHKRSDPSSRMFRDCLANVFSGRRDDDDKFVRAVPVAR